MRAVALVASLALIVASAASVAPCCPCGRHAEAAASVATACHGSADSTAVFSAGCACISAAPSDGAATRVRPIVASGAAPCAPAPVLLSQPTRAVPAAGNAWSGTPRARSRPLVLRI